MWPWEHFAIGYVVASLVLRSRKQTLTSGAFVAIALGTQFPDLVDKPLAWAFNVLPSGTTLAHSIFVAVPFSVVVILLSARFDRGYLGVVFAVGYLLHLPGDVLYGTVTTGTAPVIEAVLWPLVSVVPPESAPGLLAQISYFVGKYQRFLSTPRAVQYLLFEVTLLGAALFLWRLDGYPGVGLLQRLRHSG